MTDAYSVALRCRRSNPRRAKPQAAGSDSSGRSWQLSAGTARFPRCVRASGCGSAFRMRFTLFSFSNGKDLHNKWHQALRSFTVAALGRHLYSAVLPPPQRWQAGSSALTSSLRTDSKFRPLQLKERTVRGSTANVSQYRC